MKRYLLLVGDQPVVCSDLGTVDILMHNLDGTNFESGTIGLHLDFDDYREKLSREWRHPLPLGAPMSITSLRKGNVLETANIERPATRRPSRKPEKSGHWLAAWAGHWRNAGWSA